MPQSCLNCKKKGLHQIQLEQESKVGSPWWRHKAGNTLNRIYTEKGNGEFVESHKVSTQKPFMSKFVTRKGRSQKKGNHKTEEHKKKLLTFVKNVKRVCQGPLWGLE